jgi:hypothetical protein
MVLNVVKKLHFSFGSERSFVIIVASRVRSAHRRSVEVGSNNVAVFLYVIPSVEGCARNAQYISMSSSRARAHTGLLLVPSERSSSGSDAKPVCVFEVKLALEVDETMEMISAISMALPPNVVSSAKLFDKIYKLAKWPVRPGLTVREQVVSRNPTWVISAEPLSRQTAALELAQLKVLGELEGVTLLSR